MTGEGKEERAGATEQAGADHPDGHDIKLSTAKEFFRNSAGEKTLPPGSNTRPAQTIALFARWDGLEQSGIDIAALLQDQMLAGNAMPVAFRGDHGEFFFDPFAGKRTVNDVDQGELSAGKGTCHLYGVPGNPVCIDRTIICQNYPPVHCAPGKVHSIILGEPCHPVS